MSELANETLLDRFGDATLDRLVRLHDSARFQLDDGEVRTDSRLSFVANHLAKARLPEKDADRDRQQIKAMRESASLALWEAPWRFSRWRSLLRLAARRPVTAGEDEKDHEEANRWADDLLALVKWDGRWCNEWPESEPNPECWPEPAQVRPPERLRSLILGFHQTAFWRSLAGIVVDLRRTATAIEDRTGSIWSADHWSFRALDENQIDPVWKLLSDIDRWSNLLYGTGDRASSSRLEAEGIVHAVMAAHSRAEVADALVHSSARPTDAPLALLRTAPTRRLPTVVASRLHQAGCLTNDPRRLPTLACLRLADPDRERERRRLRNQLSKLTGNIALGRCIRPDLRATNPARTRLGHCLG